MTAILVEAGFMDYKKEARWMVDDDFQEEVATEVLKGCCEYLGIEYQESNHQGTPILNSPSGTVSQAKQWAKNNKATDIFIDLAPIYWELSPHCGGVDPAIAYAQAAQETGFGRFGGVIDETYHNPCGLKTSQGGANYNPNAHQRFQSWKEGIIAHLDHLALYAGAKEYPKKNTPDPRHFSYLKGLASIVEELGGKWAPSQDYGRNIVIQYVEKLWDTVVQSDDTDEEKIKRLEEKINLLEEDIKKMKKLSTELQSEISDQKELAKQYKNIIKKIKNLVQEV